MPKTEEECSSITFGHVSFTDPSTIRKNPVAKLVETLKKSDFDSKEKKFCEGWHFLEQKMVNL